jgi:hypothetical protein
VFEGYSRGSKIQRVSVTAEMHSTYSVNDADRFSSGAFVLGNTENDLSLVNGVLGAHVTCPGSTITLGYGFPLTVDDKVFDGELRCFVNKFF